MLERDDLKPIFILGHLTDDMLDKLLPIIDVLRFDEREIIFNQGDPADRFYMVKRGKIILEHRVSDKVVLTIGAVKPGFAFGWSSMLEGQRYTADAICAEAADVFSFRREKIWQLMEQDHSMGFVLMQRLLRIVKNRLDNRTVQLLRLIKSHPDMQALF